MACCGKKVNILKLQRSRVLAARKMKRLQQLKKMKQMKKKEKDGNIKK